jgi:hypothetical protein
VRPPRRISVKKFIATIGKVGINPYVDVPEAISAALGGPGYIPVAATIDGHPFPANLVPLGKGRYRLFLHGEMRRAAGKDVGDGVTIGLRLDTEPRVVPVRPELQAALDADPPAHAVFDALTPYRRSEILRYINNLKKPDSIARRIAILMARLRLAVGSDVSDLKPRRPRKSPSPRRT